jgi:decaprenyl-phosphate phosphoribosyltransferase
MDADADARHPVKMGRPVASGLVSRRVASILGLVLALLAVLLAAPGHLRLVVLGYLAVTASYSVWLKHEPVLELGLVSGGFLLRAVAGAAATALPLSQWFLIVTAFGSLFMVTGKRLSELTAAQDQSAIVRRSLTSYPLSYLRTILGVSAAVTITGYCLWAFEVGSAHRGGTWVAVSVAPFVLAMMRYSLDTDLGHAEEPEEVVFRDPALLALGAIWLLTFGLGVTL